MAEQRRKKKKIKLFFPLLIVSMLLVFFVIQWYLINRNKIETVKASEGYINDSILSVGIICRDERIMDNAQNGYFYYNVENGDRVSSGMLIGQVYPSSQDIDNIYKYNDIESQIEKLDEAKNFMSTVNVDISIIRRQLGNNMADLSQLLTCNNYKNVYRDMTDIALNLNKINAAMNREGDIETTKSELENQYTNIKSQISQPIESIYSPTSGYFVNMIDGYEQLAIVDNFKNISAEDGLNIIQNPIELPDNNAYGKIITNYRWNLCTYVTDEQMQKLKEGQRLKLSLNPEGNEYQTVVVESIVPQNDMNLVVLKSTTMYKEVVNTRVTDCEILFNQYKGIKIPTEAIRFVNGEQGVYVKFSKLVQFKKVKPVYQDENYAILPLAKDENNQVELYDDIIVKGVNLYDGKYL